MKESTSQDIKIEQMNQRHIRTSYAHRPHKHDVFCGRGNNIYCHPGNQFYQKLVKAVRVEYVASSRLEKRACAQYVVDTIRTLTPPGKFLAFGDKDKTYHEIGDEKAVQKTRQALREGAPDIKKGLKDGRIQARTKKSQMLKTFVSDESRKLYEEHFLPSCSSTMAVNDADNDLMQIDGPGQDCQVVQEGAVKSPSVSISSSEMLGLVTNQIVHPKNSEHSGLPHSISFTADYIEKYNKVQSSPPGPCHHSSLGYSQPDEKEHFLPGIPDISNTGEGDKNDLLYSQRHYFPTGAVSMGSSARNLPTGDLFPCASPLHSAEDKLPTKSGHQPNKWLPGEMLLSQGNWHIAEHKQMMPISLKDPTSCYKKIHDIKNVESISMGSFLKSSIESVGNAGMDQLLQKRSSINSAELEKECNSQGQGKKTYLGASKYIRALQVLLDDDSVEGGGDESEDKALDPFASNYEFSNRCIKPSSGGSVGLDIISESLGSSLNFKHSSSSGRTLMKMSLCSQMLMSVEEETESIGTFDRSDDESLNE